MCKENKCIIPLVISIILGILIGSAFYTGTLSATIIQTPIIFATIFVSIALILILIATIFAIKKEIRECICQYGNCLITGEIATLFISFFALTFLGSLVAGSVVPAFLLGLGGLFFSFTFIIFVEFIFCLVNSICRKDREDCKFDSDYNC